MISSLSTIKESFDLALLNKPWSITFQPEHEWMCGGDVHHGVIVLADGERVGYERSWFPWNIFKEPSHWCLSDFLFFDEVEGRQAAEAFGGELIGDPYDDAAWYLEFRGEDRYERLAAYSKLFASQQPQVAGAAA